MATTHSSALALTLLLAVATPVTAGTNFYENGQRVEVSQPLTVTAPGSIEWPVEMPVMGLPGTVYFKNCAIHPELWDGSEPPEDEHITLYAVRTNYNTGKYRIKFGDRSESGRTYQVCLRLPYMPIRTLLKQMIEAYEQYEAEEE
jgi:hypothetical protein